MRVLIWGGDSWANQGDDAVLAGTLAGLRRYLRGGTIVVASDSPAETKARHNVEAVRRWSPALLWTLARANLVIWGGGMLIQDQSSKAFMAVQLAFLAAALTLRKPVVCYGQGAGPVRGRLFRLALRHALRRLALVAVRDRASARRLKALGASNVLVLADPCLCMEPEAPDLPVREPFIAVALRRWGHYRGGWLPVRWARPRPSEQYDRFCGEVAAALDVISRELGVDVLLVPMCAGGDQHDDRMAQVVMRLMTQQAAALGAPLSPAALMGLLGRAEMVLAMRTHAAILAAGAGTPALSISYQGKGRAFMAELGLPEYCLPWQQVTQERLVETAGRLWCERERVRARLGERVPELRARAWRNASLVAQAVRQPAERPPLRPGAYYRSLVARHLGIRPGKGWTLDLGAGDGSVFTGPVVALDAKPRRGFVHGDGTALPFASGAFETVLAMDVLEHVPDDRRFWCEALRVVAPGGTVWVSTPSRDMRLFPAFLSGIAHRAWGHMRPGYTRWELEALSPPGASLTLYAWNEPAYRALYPAIRALAFLAPPAARWLIRAAFRFDARHPEGERGHFFCRITTPAGTGRSACAPSTTSSVGDRAPANAATAPAGGGACATSLAVTSSIGDKAPASAAAAPR